MTATASSFEAAWRVASGIDGWLSEGQSRELDRAARAVRPGQAIVEIGSHHGRSTVILAGAKGPDVRLLAVDPFGDPRWGGGEDALPVFRANLERAGLDGQVDVFRGVSAEAIGEWDGSPIGLLFVDGAHDRASVLTDLDGWEPFVAEQGKVFLHDAFSSPGVTFALLQRHLANRAFRYLGSVRSLVMLERERLGVSAAAASGLRLAGRLPYFARNVAIKGAMRRGWQAPQRLLGHNEPGYPY